MLRLITILAAIITAINAYAEVVDVKLNDGKISLRGHYGVFSCQRHCQRL